MAKKKKAAKKKATPKRVAKAKLPSKIDINYIKTSDYRTFHVDGVFGGITPSGKMNLILFTQRGVIPQKVTREISEEGFLGGRVAKEGKTGIVREIEAGLVMDLDIAKSLRDWIDDKLKTFEK